MDRTHYRGVKRMRTIPLNQLPQSGLNNLMRRTYHEQDDKSQCQG